MPMAFAPNAGYTANIRPEWAGDVLTRDHNLPGGVKVDAAAFNPADAVQVVVGAAGAAAGATTVPVDALSGAIPAGTFLNFGTYAPVTVTVDDADVNAGETSFGVDALSGPIPAGAFLSFGAGVYARLTANAAAGATTLAVEALPADIADDATATFAGGTKQARLTAPAASGATSLTVDELQFALVDDETAYYGAPGAKKRIASGTVVGCTHAELEAAAAGGLLWGPAADADDIVRIILFDIPDADENNDAELYRAGSLVKVNFLPGWATLSTAVKNKIRAQYETTVGGPGMEVPAS